MTEPLYRKRADGTYQEVVRCDELSTIPPGRYVVVVDGSRGCRMQSVANVDEATFASLQLFRWALERAICEESKRYVGGTCLTKKQTEAIAKIAGKKLCWITTKSAGTIAQDAIERWLRHLDQHWLHPERKPLADAASEGDEVAAKALADWTKEQSR